MSDEEAQVNAIRMAWGIGISQAEAESAACVIQERRRRRPNLPESYWVRALGNLMLDYARHSKERRHAVLEILYPHRTKPGNYVEDALIAAIDAQRPDRRRQQSQVDKILAKILQIAGHIEHVNTTGATHEDFVTRLLKHKKIPWLRMRSTLQFTNPLSGAVLLTAEVTSYYSWPVEHREWSIKRSAITLHPAPGISTLPVTIHCRITRDPVNEGGLVLTL